MTRDDLLAHAQIALDVLQDAVLCDAATYARPSGLAEADASVERLRALLAQAPGPTPDDAPRAQTAAVLVLLHALNPMAWKRLARQAVAGGDAETGTLAGLVALSAVAALVSNDHNLSLDPDADGPTLVLQDALSRSAPTVTPRALLDALGPLVGLSAQPATP